MEKVRVEDAVGMVLAHDLTKIVPGTFKGAAFKKGYIVRAEDIEELKNIGKNHLWVVPCGAEQIHENEAAHTVAGSVVTASGFVTASPLEGKSNIHAAQHGMLKVNRAILDEINRIGEIALVTLHNNTEVRENELVAAAKIIPLVIDREKIEKVKEICSQEGPVLNLKPFSPLKTGIIVTGSEVYYGRIQDRFGVALQGKIAQYGGEFLELHYAPDELDFISGKITELLDKGAEIILISGGMAVDADDVTPQAIREAATEIISYGAPVLPGAMCMIAYHHKIPLVGVPACAMFNKTTIFDLIYPRLLAGERITKEDILAFAHGGLCLRCDTRGGECRYPDCSFGK